MAKVISSGAVVEIESGDEDGADFEVNRERLLFPQLALVMDCGIKAVACVLASLWPAILSH